MSNYAIVTLDDSSNKTVTGVHNYVRSQGGVLIIPAGTSFPVAPNTEAGEIFYNQTDGKLYRRDDGNVSWVAISPGASIVPNSRQVIAGAGLTGGGALSSDVTINAVANPDGSIVVAADDIRVGVINDTQHGTRGGGTQHATATTSVAGFMSAADKTKLNGLGSEVPQSRTLTAGISLAGGGDLTADRTFDLSLEAVTVSEAIGGQSFNTGNNILNFDTVTLTTGSFYSYTEPTLTVQQTGLYVVRFHLNIDKLSSSSRSVSTAAFFVNGVAVEETRAYGIHFTPSQGLATLLSSTVLNLANGDQLTIRAGRLSGGGNLGVVGGRQSSFSVWRVG